MLPSSTAFRHAQMAADTRALALDALLAAPRGAYDAAAVASVVAAAHPPSLGWRPPPTGAHGAARCAPVTSDVWRRRTPGDKPPVDLPLAVPRGHPLGTVLAARSPVRPPPTLAVRRSRIAGLGLYTLADIPAGGLACEYVGAVVRESVADVRCARPPPHVGPATYMFGVPRCVTAGDSPPLVIDATAAGSAARYVNSACVPNLEAEAVPGNPPRVLMLARRDVAAGEELTYAYHLSEGGGDEDEACACGSAWCRRVL